jgi:HNH endonuclease
MEPTKEQMYQWYVVEQKSYRQIMKLIGTKSNRKIPKLLNKYDIPIRKGSDAVKTQWINNESRRKKQGEIFAEVHSGKKSPRRMPLSELKKRYLLYNIDILEREFINGYTVLNCRCVKCGYKFSKNLKNNSRGCLCCGIERTTEKQRLDFSIVEKAFNDSGVVLVETDYLNSNTPMSFICPKHAALGEQKQSYQGLKERGACKYCRIERRRKEKKLKLPPRKAIQHLLKEWRMAVFERDKFICQCCGWDKGGILQAHHIKNFSKHPHLRLDIDNGITLCENCHDPHIKGSFHNVYGVRNNTPEQLHEYITKRQASI